MWNRIGIVGLPGSGKTSIAIALISILGKGEIAENKPRWSYVNGDMILPENIVKVCGVLDKYVVEHMSLTDIMLRDNDILLDVLIYLDISAEECRKRIKNRPTHIVSYPGSIEDLEIAIRKQVSDLEKHGLKIVRVTISDENKVFEQMLRGTDLLDFLKCIK